MFHEGLSVTSQSNQCVLARDLIRQRNSLCFDEEQDKAIYNRTGFIIKTHIKNTIIKQSSETAAHASGSGNQFKPQQKINKFNRF